MYGFEDLFVDAKDRVTGLVVSAEDLIRWADSRSEVVDHWCNPGCDPGCRIKQERVWHGRDIVDMFTEDEVAESQRAAEEFFAKWEK